MKDKNRIYYSMSQKRFEKIFDKGRKKSKLYNKKGDKMKEQTCKTCRHGIYNPVTNTRMCINPDGKYNVVSDEFNCALWKKELDKE